MKKEWLFFCVFFSANLSPAISHARLIAKFSFIAVNNTITTRINIDPDRHTTVATACTPLQTKKNQHTETLFPMTCCCMIAGDTGTGVQEWHVRKPVTISKNYKCLKKNDNDK